MLDTDVSLNQRIGVRVRDLRASQGLSLDALAARSGVSRSTISLVERGATSATAVVLERIAAGLGIVMAALFDDTREAGASSSGPVARRADQPVWRDPATGYLRRNVSPPSHPSPFRIVGVRFPPGARVVFDNDRGDTVPHQQIWILEGVMNITVGSDSHELREGDCLAMVLDQPTVFENRSDRAARYAVVLASTASSAVGRR